MLGGAASGSPLPYSYPNDTGGPNSGSRESTAPRAPSRVPWLCRSGGLGVAQSRHLGAPLGTVVGLFWGSRSGSVGATAVGGVGPAAVLMVLLSYLLACLPIPEALTRHGPWSCALRCGEEVGRPRLPDLFQGRRACVGEGEVLGGFPAVRPPSMVGHSWNEAC